jgi:hypothetical protein
MQQVQPSNTSYPAYSVPTYAPLKSPIQEDLSFQDMVMTPLDQNMILQYPSLDKPSDDLPSWLMISSVIRDQEVVTSPSASPTPDIPTSKAIKEEEMTPPLMTPPPPKGNHPLPYKIPRARRGGHVSAGRYFTLNTKHNDLKSQVACLETTISKQDTKIEDLHHKESQYKRQIQSLMDEVMKLKHQVEISKRAQSSMEPSISNFFFNFAKAHAINPLDSSSDILDSMESQYAALIRRIAMSQDPIMAILWNRALAPKMNEFFQAARSTHPDLELHDPLPARRFPLTEAMEEVKLYAQFMKTEYPFMPGTNLYHYSRWDDPEGELAKDYSWHQDALSSITPSPAPTIPSSPVYTPSSPLPSSDSGYGSDVSSYLME